MSPSARAGDSFPAPRAASSIPSSASPPALAEFGVAAALAAPSAAAQHTDGVQAPSDGASLPVGHPGCTKVPARHGLLPSSAVPSRSPSWWRWQAGCHGATVPPHGAVGGQKRVSLGPCVGQGGSCCRGTRAATSTRSQGLEEPHPAAMEGWR